MCICCTVGFGASGEPEGSIQVAGWTMSGGWLQLGSSALVFACMFLSLVPWPTLCSVKLTFWKVVSKEPPARVWWVTRGSRGLPRYWQCWGSWVGWGSGTGQCCWHCWCWHWSLKMSSCWEWRWSLPTSHEMETQYLPGCCQTYWCAKVAGWWMSGGTRSCHHFGNSWHGFRTSLQLSVRETEIIFPLWGRRCAMALVFPA